MAFVTVIFWSEFPEITAPVRFTDQAPSILAVMDGSPRGKVFLVKVDADKGRNKRYLKMGNSGFGSVSGATSPDQDWVIPSTTKETRPGVWEFTPNALLKKGEYGLFVSISAGFSGAMGGELFDFAID
jgi:hypothetical protein